jgi:hypothetical protein
MVWIAVLATGGLMQVPALAQTQYTAPTDVEREAAYCMSVVSSQIDILQKANTAGEFNATHSPTADQRQTFQQLLDQGRMKLAKLQATQSRLKSYLAPRTMTLDPVAMAAAAKQGEADVRALVDTRQCQMTCMLKSNAALFDEEKKDACTRSCVGDDVVAGVQQCYEASWLPP